MQDGINLKVLEYFKNNQQVARACAILQDCLSKQFPGDVDQCRAAMNSFMRWLSYQTNQADQEQVVAKDDIVLEDYNPSWPKLATAEINAIKQIVDQQYVDIQHAGSTSIPGMIAKPIIDIFIALDSVKKADRWIGSLESLGYVYWYENPDKSHHRFFKGMPPFGICRTHHVHIVEFGADFSKRLEFRDRLRWDSVLADEYRVLKLELAKRYQFDREKYTEAKLDFIQRVTG